MPSVSKRPVRFATLAGIAVAGLLLSACGMTDAPQTTFVPQGSNADAIYALFKPVFWVAVAVFVIVEGLLILSIIRYRRRPDDGIPLQIHGNTPVEIAWTILPAIIVVGIATMTFRTQGQLEAPQQDPLRVTVIGHQWWWEFQYPDYDIVTANELHLPANRDIEFSLKSDDVIHSFWIPRISGKTDTVPGHTNILRTRTQDPIATPIRGQCAEYCQGTHAMMGLWAIVQPQDQFDQWVQTQTQAALVPDGITQAAAPSAAASTAASPAASTAASAAPSAAASAAPSAAGAQPTSLEAKGYQLFAQKGCVGCHVISGYPGAVSRVGPDLTHVGSRENIVAGWLENTPENMQRWLRNPDEVKPGNRMTAVVKAGYLKEDEIQALTAYLESLK